MDTTVERDGHFRQPAAVDSPKFMWICPSELAKKIEEDREQWLLLDTRSFSLYSGKHIDNARSFAFAPMLMKRLLKGTASLDSLILRLTDTSLLSTIGAAERIVLYDSNSTPSETKVDLVKLVETLQTRFENKLNIRVLLGKYTVNIMDCLSCLVYNLLWQWSMFIISNVISIDYSPLIVFSFGCRWYGNVPRCISKPLQLQ